MDKLKPCPFCGGRGKINARQSKFCGMNHLGNKKLIWQIYVMCTKCHSRGRPIKTEPLKFYADDSGLNIGNFYCTEFWMGSGRGLMTATLNFEPYVEKAIEAWNWRVEHETD